jgi:hypothetical protein
MQFAALLHTLFLATDFALGAGCNAKNKVNIAIRTSFALSNIQTMFYSGCQCTLNGLDMG